ncbi:MAG: hypothetical protein IT484_10025 [Gammaproteobacteria bacterium]|nr:hypothetical protein [Gammaproteobacteria bacterium]
MRSVLAYGRSFLLLAFSLLLTLQVSGTHLHLCFDGQAPPVQVHLVDTPGNHGNENVAEQHVDKDLQFAGSPAVRDKSSSPDLPPVLPASWPTGYSPVQLVAAGVPEFQTSFQFQQIHELLPPSRGPPLTARA